MGAQRQSVLLRGVLDICLLALLDHEELYGYEVADRFRRLGMDVAPGTVYPLLARLERAGQIRSVERASDEGPVRRYWQVTADGRAVLSEGRAVWVTHAQSVGSLLDAGRTVRVGRGK